MSGNTSGGLKGRDTLREKYGKDHFKNIGKSGAEKYRLRQAQGIAKPRGFAAMSPERRSEAGKKGGKARTGYRKIK